MLALFFPLFHNRPRPRPSDPNSFGGCFSPRKTFQLKILPRPRFTSCRPASKGRRTRSHYVGELKAFLLRLIKRVSTNFLWQLFGAKTSWSFLHAPPSSVPHAHAYVLMILVNYVYIFLHSDFSFFFAESNDMCVSLVSSVIWQIGRQ